MTHPYIFRALNRFLLSVLAVLTLCVSLPCSASAPPVPVLFQDLYTSLQGDLDSFNATLKPGTGYPVLLTGTLSTANSNVGPSLGSSGYITGVETQLEELKAMGVQAVDVEIGFLMLYRPFFSSDSVYQQYVSFYAQVASSVRALGMKLIVENNCLLSNDVSDGWNTAPFYRTLNWDQYQQGRADRSGGSADHAAGLSGGD